jgi:hypothetical protein
VFLAVCFVDRQSRLRWPSFSVLLYLAGGDFGFLATQNLFGDVSLDFLIAERLAAFFNLINLSCDVSIGIERCMASFICFNLKSRSWTVSEFFVFLFTS